MSLIKLSRTFAISTIFAIGALTLSAPASATFIFSNVSHTTNSLTFTIDGDMTGYASPGDTTQFSIRLLGDTYTGPASGYTANSWSASPFDNKTSSGGNLYDGTSTVPYIWTSFSGNLADAVATMNAVTVSWAQNWLNPAATDPTFQFVWGNGNDSQNFTVLATVEAAAVPEPVSLALLGLGLAGIGLSRRKKQKAA